MIENLYTVASVLRCYMKSETCRNKAAHCHKVVDDPFRVTPKSSGGGFTISITDKKIRKYNVEIDQYLFPCSFMEYRFHFQNNHPASIEDQIHAAAVEHGCNWCPNFRADDWQKVGTRLEMRESSD